MSDIWTLSHGRELDSTPLTETRRGPIVACLNFWNDLQALKQTVPTWRRFISRIIAVDGAYQSVGHGLSTDGSREFLLTLPNVTLLDAAGVAQCDKRTRYLEAGRAGEMLFIVDADELIQDGETLLNLPSCDIGWVRVKSSLYRRTYGQPRIIRWMPNLRYHGRHHWIYQGGQLLCTHQYGGTGYAHRPIKLMIENRRQLGRSASRMGVKHHNQSTQLTHERDRFAIPESVMSDSAIEARESLQILMHAYRDDGMAPSRLHTAINRTTPHSSILMKVQAGPFGVPEQYLVGTNLNQLRLAASTADILHFHGVMSAVKVVGASSLPCVFHHHGTLYRRNAPEYNRMAKDRNALILLSNLELFDWTDGSDAFFLPNTVPVARYRALVRQSPVRVDGKFRVSHSPSHPHKKGTEHFIAVCAHLQSKGYPIEPVILHGLPHSEVLKQKATCHAAFDSFWLGMQCSGIESAAMELPVIAGDSIVAARYETHFGAVPYTFADNAEQLESALIKLMSDSAFYQQERARVATYVQNHHDESAVALKYLDLLDQKFGWRSNKLKNHAHTKQRRPLVHR